MNGIVKIKETLSGFIYFTEGIISDGNYAIEANYARFSNKALEELRVLEKPFKYDIGTKKFYYDVENFPKTRRLIEPEKIVENTSSLIDTKCSCNLYNKNNNMFHIFITSDNKKEYAYINEQYYQMFLPLLEDEHATIESSRNNKVVYKDRNGKFLGVIMCHEKIGHNYFLDCYFEQQQKQQYEKQVTV